MQAGPPAPPRCQRLPPPPLWLLAGLQASSQRFLRNPQTIILIGAAHVLQRCPLALQCCNFT